MTKELINQTIKEILSEIIDLDEFSYDLNTPFNEIKNIDSITMLQLMVAAEKKFNVNFNDCDVDLVFFNISSLSDYILNNDSSK